ncbi:hypothetical protein DEJ16_13065 [Curtobacterium sp. MCJR17_055]|nr:hypothetical protein DEI87_10490 [Curtobacterium sp. MCBD17_029]PYY54014.1 hypothetical protein DEJ16_13065 [Curtobacterium sp. MCJR17_055]
MTTPTAPPRAASRSASSSPEVVSMSAKRIARKPGSVRYISAVISMRASQPSCQVVAPDASSVSTNRAARRWVQRIASASTTAIRSGKYR